jgi:uncharacterized protein DUF4190
MAFEPGQSGQVSQSTHEEQLQEALPIPTGMPVAEPGKAAPQVSEPAAEYHPFPYGYPVYSAYPPFPTYTPSPPSPYLPYPAYPYYPVPVVPATSGLAIASFICGLLTLFAFPYLGIAGAICGHLALSQIRSSGGIIGGRGFAIAGLILAYVMLGIGVIGMILYFLFIFIIISTPIPGDFLLPLAG